MEQLESNKMLKGFFILFICFLTAIMMNVGEPSEKLGVLLFLRSIISNVAVLSNCFVVGKNEGFLNDL